MKRLAQTASILLLFNPDHYAAWNVRCVLQSWHFGSTVPPRVPRGTHVPATSKKLHELGLLTVEDDLAFMNLVLTRHPKSPETMVHRKWLLERHLARRRGDDDLVSQLSSVERLVASEVLLCDRLALAYAKNYYVWTYRAALFRDLLPVAWVRCSCGVKQPN